MIPYLAGVAGRPAVATVVTSGHDFRELKQPLVLCFSLVDYDQEKQNITIDRFLAGTNPHLLFNPWNGSVLVLKYGDNHCTTFVDIEHSDLSIFQVPIASYILVHITR